MWELAGTPVPRATTTAYTIGLDDPAAMGRAAGGASMPLLKLKLGAEAPLDDRRRLLVALELGVDPLEHAVVRDRVVRLDEPVPASMTFS